MKRRMLFAAISFPIFLVVSFLSALPAEAIIYVSNSASSGNSVTTWPDDTTGDIAPTTNIVGASTTFDRPSGVAVDASWIYVVNTVNNSVDVFPVNADGNVAPTRSITNTNFATRFINPNGVAVDANWIYVTNSGNASIDVFPIDADGTMFPTRSIKGASTNLGGPLGIAVDASWIYVTNALGVLVFPINATGDVAPSRLIQGGATTLDTASGVAVDAGWIYVTSYDSGSFNNGSIRIFQIGADGNVAPTRSIQGFGTTLNWPRGIAVDASWMYVTSSGNNSIKVYPVNADGSVAPTRSILGAATTLNTPYGIAVSGTAVIAPDITVTDSVAPNTDLQIPFGDITEMTSANQTMTVSNDGNADLTLGNIAVTNALAAPFSTLNDTCSGQTLAPAANCSLTVRFSPASIGIFSDSFDIPSDDPGENPVTVSVSGNGVGVPAPDITVTDAVAPVNDLQVPFGSVTAMTTADQVITVTNDGNADLAIGNVATADALLAPFSVLNDNCSSQTLTPAANCTFTVRFAPTTTGDFSDSLDVPSDDANKNPVTVNVSGTGAPIPVPNITVTDTLAPANDLQMPFADRTVGGSSDQTVDIINDGNADLAMGNVAQANALAAPFSVVNDTCSGQTLVATASCTLDVRFAPTAAGTSNDSFDIPSNDPDEDPVTINVSGTGLAGVNNPPSSPNLVSPADGQTGLPTTLDLKWEPSTDPDGDTVSYDVYHCTDTDPVANCFPINGVVTLNGTPNTGSGNGLYYAGLGLGGGIMILGITLPGGVRGRKQTVLLVATLVIITLLGSCKSDGFGNNAGNANQSYAVAGLAAGTTYYWAVVARDGNGGATPSAVWSYSTQ